MKKNTSPLFKDFVENMLGKPLFSYKNKNTSHSIERDDKSQISNKLKEELEIAFKNLKSVDGSDIKVDELTNLRDDAIKKFCTEQDYLYLSSNNTIHERTIDNYKPRAISFMHDIIKFKESLFIHNIDLKSVFIPKEIQEEVTRDILSDMGLSRMTSIHELPSLVYQGITMFFYDSKEEIIKIATTILKKDIKAKLGVLKVKNSKKNGHPIGHPNKS